MKRFLAAVKLLAALSLTSAPSATASVEAVKIGLVLPMTGPFQSTGWQANAAVNLFLQQRGRAVAGRDIDVILKDDAGLPDNSKRLVQELIVNDHVNVLMGFGLTPSALAAAPLATEGKIPMIVTVASTAAVVDRSPFVVRTIQTIPQIANIVGAWAAKSGIKSAVSIVSDYAPGQDAEAWFTKSFEQGGGKVLQKLRPPLNNPDFAPFLQRARDASPEALFAFVPAGVGAVFARQILGARARQIWHADCLDERRNGRRCPQWHGRCRPRRDLWRTVFGRASIIGEQGLRRCVQEGEQWPEAEHRVACDI
jgi:branched-chain amino acid transport system substrate-binding protein